jgi:DnaJ-class molecular chaperone
MRKRNIKIKVKYKVCPTCGGNGFDPTDPMYTCSTCFGRGKIKVKDDYEYEEMPRHTDCFDEYDEDFDY